MTYYQLIISDLTFTLELIGAIATFCYIIYLLTKAPFFTDQDFSKDQKELFEFNPFINYALIGKNILFKKSLFNQRVCER